MNRRETGIFTAVAITAAAVIVLVVAALWATTDGFAAWSSNITLSAADDTTPIAGSVNVVNAGTDIDATLALGVLTLNNTRATATPQATATPNVIKPSLDRLTSDRWVLPGWEFNGTTSTPSLTDDVMYLTPIRFPYPVTITAVAAGIDTSATNGIFRVCLYTHESVTYSDDGLSPGILAHDFGTGAATSIGTVTITDTYQVTSGGFATTGGFFFLAIIPRGDTPIVMRSVNPFNMLSSPITGYGATPGGSQRLYGLETAADTDFIDVGCPSDGTGIVTAHSSSASYPIVWFKENG